MKKSTIYREDAIDAVHKYFNDAINNEPRGINKDGYDVFTDAKSVNALLYHNKMVSKALSALPSAEVVSREDYHNLLMASNDIDRALREYQAKEESESAEAVQSWIPCSERLPEDGDSVIVTVIDDHGDTSWRYTDVAWLCEGTWIANNEILFGDVLAWMPLPTPYKGGTE